MPERLSALDASFLYLEQPGTPMHVGGVAIFRRPRAGFDYDRLVELIEGTDPARAAVPAEGARGARPPRRPGLGGRRGFRHRLPRPPLRAAATGDDAALHELVARLMSRPLDRDRPLWEMYLVEGLAKNRFAVITKTHQALVDGNSAIDIGQVILDVSADPAAEPARPAGSRVRSRATSSSRWTRCGDLIARPGALADGVRGR